MTHFLTPSPDGRVDILAEISSALEGPPPLGGNTLTWVLFTGGPGSGKTTIRRDKYAHSGYVTLDAGEIFIRLCRGRYVAFPPPPEERDLAEALELIGYGIALRAVRGRRNIVTELIGASPEPLGILIDTIKAARYHCELTYVNCDVQEAWKRNLTRGDDNISAYYTEPFHHRWILAAIQAALPLTTTGGAPAEGTKE
jgi:hypothetical protein